MASVEHIELAQFIKDVHLSLRQQSAAIGVKAAWENHCKDKAKLSKYSENMTKLATTYWNNNSSNPNYSKTTSRIEWATDVTFDYFINKKYMNYREKEIVIGNKINLTINTTKLFPDKPIKLLDVGSCYNPFKINSFMDVLAIDLHPADDTVYQCDFLHVSLGANTIKNGNRIEQLEENGFKVITFCFLLEYLPTSELRIQACKNAYNLLKFEGLLIIITPDSKHVGANSKIMKCWRYTLAHIGFTRIKYEKFQHMHCMAFRKSLHLNIATRWAELHKEQYMDLKMNIPQDFSSTEDIEKKLMSRPKPIHFLKEDFLELPFYTES